MASMSSYYARAKGGIANINPAEMAQFSEDMMLAGATGLGLGFISASIGGLDKEVAGLQIPIDGLAALGLGLFGLSNRTPEINKAAIAAMGSVSTRMSERFFKRAFGVHGEGDDLPALSSDYAYGYDWGAEGDPLLMAAQGL